MEYRKVTVIFEKLIKRDINCDPNSEIQVKKVMREQRKKA